MFVLDYIPQEYLHGGPKDSVILFTAGWAMKFVPLLGKALAEMALRGGSEYARTEFSITRRDSSTGKGIIVKGNEVEKHVQASSAFASSQQASGSSLRRHHKAGHP